MQLGKHHKRLPARLILTMFTGLLLMACTGPAMALDKVSIQLHWVHQAQFAGFYMAQDAGLYEETGLEVEIIPGGPGIDPLDNLKDGKCDFATAWLIGAMEVRSEGTPLVHLSQIVQRSAMMLVTFEDSDIDSIKDLTGHRVGMWGGHFSILPKALFRREGVSIIEVPQNFSMAPFLRGAVAAASAMYYNELHQLYQAGVDPDEIVVFEFAKLGLNFPEDGIYTMEKLWREQPGICHRFVEASLLGWRLSFEEPERALDSVMKRVDEANLASNKPHQRWMLKTLQELISDRVGLQGLGELSADDFDLVNQVLTKQGLIKGPVDMDAFNRPTGEKQP